jgi:hypothetical protein
MITRVDVKLFFASIFCCTTLLAQDTSRFSPKAIATPSKSQAKSAGRLLGVFDSETAVPLEGVEVIDLLGTQLSLATKAAGLVSLRGFKNQHDSAAVRVRKIGYRDTSFIVLVGPADTVPITLALERIAVDLDPVLTTAHESRRSFNMQGFEERRTNKALRGSFVTPEELRAKWDGQVLGIVFATHGMRPMPRGPTSMTTTRCRTLYYVNGVIGSIDPNKEVADSFEAIEYYPDWKMAPPQYVGSFAANVCGIYVLWMRGS